MAGKLDRYRELRDEKTTPEPMSEAKEGAASCDELPRFVVQEHHASSLHWDLRLEHEGVLVSWAVPKGIPEDPSVNRLAVHVEDHPLSYIDFEGEIPKGSYGAGKVLIWDSGTYEREKFRKDEVIVVLHGERITGRYVLFQTDGKNWMLHRMDPALDPSREPMPERLDVMNASAGEMPADPEKYAFEIKWDGIRALTFSEHGHLKLQGRRNYSDITNRYPELRKLGRDIASHDVVLDGEIVSLDPEGRPSFQLLQERMNLNSPAAIRRLSQTAPVTYIIFDLLYINGHFTTGLAYADRRRLLDALEIDGDYWKVPQYHVDGGPELLTASLELGLEGVMAKRLDSEYLPGKRANTWIKIKNRLRQEFVVGGFMPGRGNRKDRVGSLALGVWSEDESGERSLIFCGKVGSGFSEEENMRITDLLRPLIQPTSTFEGRQPPNDTTFTKPELVVEVAFTEWTHDHSVRNGVYFGTRDDKDPKEVVRET